MLAVSCQNCHAVGYTEDHSNPDAAVACITAADDPPGSAEGTCCTVHGSHEEHHQAVAQTGDASCRPVTITVLPGSVSLQPAQETFG